MRKINVFKYPNMAIVIDGGIRRIISDSTIFNMSEDDIKNWYLKVGENNKQ